MTALIRSAPARHAPYLAVSTLVVENEQQVFAAMITLKEDQGSFADALIAALGTKAGCSHAYL